MRALLSAAVTGWLFLAGAPAAAAGPAWIWPVAGPPVVLRGFQPPPTPYSAGHRGVDLAADVGAPIHAAGAGIVGYAGPLAGRGVVTVMHGALRTTYEPVTASVHRGDHVAAGQVIGHLEAGNHCGRRPCLHWGLLRGTVYLDPLALVGAARIRLLPVAGVPPPWGDGAGAAAVMLGVGLCRRRRPRSAG